MCHKLKKIEGLENIRSLEEFKISDCQELEVLLCLPKIYSLKKIQLKKCHKLEKIKGLENIRSVENLRVQDCPELDGLPGLAELTSLKKFDLERCPKLKKIEGLENIKSLEELEISDCPELEMPELTYLKELVLKNCHKLEKIEGLENIRSVENLRVHDCPELDGLPGLAELTSLKEFDMKRCPKLKKIEGLENIKSLEKLKISDCPELEALPSLPELTSLKEFELRNCHKLERMRGLERLRLLEKLELYTRWNAPCIVSLKHSERLESLVVVANHILAVEPFVSNIQKWPRKVMICTRAEYDVSSLKSLFEELPNVSVLDYSDVVGVNCFRVRGKQKWLQLRKPKISTKDNSVLICFTIYSDHPDLYISTELGNYASCETELGEGKWVWMCVFTQLPRRPSLNNADYIHAHNSKNENVRVKVEAAWFVTGGQGAIVEAFSKHVADL